MPSDKRICRCNRCLLLNPAGQMLSSSYVSRHAKEQEQERRAASALKAIEEAERKTAAQTITMAAPGLRERFGAQIPVSSPISTTSQDHTDCSAGDHNAEHGHEGLAQQMKQLETSLDAISLSAFRGAVSLSRPFALQFTRDPMSEDPAIWQQLRDEIALPTSEALAHQSHFLLTDHPCNATTLQSERLARASLRQIEHILSIAGPRAWYSETLWKRCQEIKETLNEALSQILHWKEDIWKDQRQLREEGRPLPNLEDSLFAHHVDTTRYMSSSGMRQTDHPLILSNTTMVLILNLVFGLSERGCLTFLLWARCQLELAAMYSNGAIPASLADYLPRTLKSSYLHFDLNPSLHQYIVCPECFALYPYPVVSPLPMYCISTDAPGGPACNSRLLMKRYVNGKTIYVPVKMFLHQDLKQWLARFICRLKIEQIIRASQHPVGRKGDLVTDILGSDSIRNFLGQDGLPFLRPVVGQYRLMFALSIDGFNPLTNRQAKQVRTSTGIYLICLNLPLALRQLPHNMFLVGVIPGPNKPKEGELNHYCDLIANDFLSLWNSGAFLTATPLCSEGVLILAALVLVICDALGAREVSGFPLVTSTQFCIQCALPIQDIENFNFKSWPLRTKVQHRKDAEEWHLADSVRRAELAKRHHPARYTSLLQLPYFDPLHFTIIDTMHIHFSGLFQRHCRNIWGMDIHLEDGDGMTRGSGAIPSPPTPEEMEVGRTALATSLPGRLASFNLNKAVLYYLCEENGLRRAGNKPDLLRQLEAYILARDGRQMAPTPGNSDGGPQAATTSDANVGRTVYYFTPESLPDLNQSLVDDFVSAEDHFARNLPIGRTKNPPLQYMCFLRGIGFFDISSNAGPVKSVMVSALSSWRARQQTSGNALTPFGEEYLEAIRVAKLQAANSRGTESQPPGVPPADRSRSRKAKRTQTSAVLGKQVLAAYAEDRRNMVFPPWMSAPPVRAGHTSHGKLSADQWRVLCSVNLPVTLIRLWGTQPGTRWYQMLENFLDLVVAVDIASMVVTSEELIVEYERRMHSYLSGLLHLYPDAPIAPNQHICLHVGDIMRGYGPTPGYRAFGPERFNYTLQQANTNRHFGEIEMAMTRAVCRSSNLASLVENPDFMAHLDKHKEVFASTFQDDRRGTRVHDVGSEDNPEFETIPRHKEPTSAQSTLENKVFSALIELVNQEGEAYVPYGTRKAENQVYLHPEAEFIREIKTGTVSYRPASLALGSSLVVVAHQGTKRPAEIQHIFNHTRYSATLPGGQQVETFVAVSFLRPLDRRYQQHNPYRHFPEFGSLWAARVEDHVTVIRPTELLSHFVRTEMDLPSIPFPCYHALPLNRLKTQFEAHGWMRGQGEDTEDGHGVNRVQ